MTIDKYIQATKGIWITGDKDTQYRIEEDDNTIRISFQGSISRFDWLQNFNFLIKPYKRMDKVFFVHRGFLKKYKAVREDIHVQIRAAVLNYKKVEIYGYSQGGALAQLLHEDILFHGAFQPETVIFGSPKVFGWWNKKELTDRLYRVTRYQNGNDIITKIPFLPYRHFGSTINIGRKRRWWKFSIKDHASYKENL